MDGSSGPGVGAVVMLVQEAGVGMMIFTVGVVLSGGGVVAGNAGVQEVKKMKTIRIKERCFVMVFPK